MNIIDVASKEVKLTFDDGIKLSETSLPVSYQAADLKQLKYRDEELSHGDVDMAGSRTDDITLSVFPPMGKECDQCHRVFYEAKQMELHKNIHAKQFLLKCNCSHCGKNFASSNVFDLHLMSCKMRNYTCDICKKKFFVLPVLKRHILNHLQRFRAYYCAECGKSFISKHSLQAHTRTHTRSKLFACEVCRKSFAEASTLRYHRSTHGDSRPFKCDTCGKAFKRSSHLIYHTRTHSGVKPFPCELCSLSFNYPSLLADHKRTHFGIKRKYVYGKRKQNNFTLTCTICNKKKRDSYDLKIHMRSHMKEKLYKCTICSASFTKQANLINHTTNYCIQRHQVGTE